MVLDDGATRAALIAIDLLFHDFALTEEIREYASQVHDVDPSAVVLGYTHTHTGPAVRGYDPGQHDDRYEEFLATRIRVALDRAACDMRPATMEFGSAVGDWNINRRLPKDGEILLAPNPEGAVDPMIRFIALRGEGGEIRGILTSYGCHTVSYRDSTVVSADYPGVLCRQLEARYDGSTALFFQSCGGNSRPRMTAKAGRFVACTYDEVFDMGTSMAAAVTRSLDRGQTAVVDPELEADSFIIPLKLRPYDRSVFEAEVAASGPRTAQAAWVLERYDELPARLDLPAGILRVAPELSIGWMGGEICYEVKRHLETIFAPSQLFFVGYADASAYIPSDQIIREGGYEADRSAMEYCLKGPIASGLDESVGAAFVESQSRLDHGR